MQKKVNIEIYFAINVYLKVNLSKDQKVFFLKKKNDLGNSKKLETIFFFIKSAC